MHIHPPSVVRLCARIIPQPSNTCQPRLPIISICKYRYKGGYMHVTHNIWHHVYIILFRVLLSVGIKTRCQKAPTTKRFQGFFFLRDGLENGAACKQKRAVSLRTRPFFILGQLQKAEGTTNFGSPFLKKIDNNDCLFYSHLLTDNLIHFLSLKINYCSYFSPLVGITFLITFWEEYHTTITPLLSLL